MNYRLISLFHSLLDDLITGCRYKNAHKRADDIKDAIREISPSRYAEDCVMPQVVHGISTEVTVTESSVVRLSRRLSNPRCLYTSLNISLFRMMAINWSAVQMFKDNPDTTVEATMLVRPRMKCKKIRVMLSSAFHEPYKYGCDASQHAARCHCTAETHGANDQPNRVHHPGHSPGRD